MQKKSTLRNAALSCLYSTATLATSILAPLPLSFFERGRRKIFERYGIWDLNLPACIWFHAASFGEMIGVRRIAEELQVLLPDEILLATATSPTGLDAAEANFAYRRLLTFDHPLYLNRVVKSVNAKVLILSEAELWPNIIRAHERRNIPCCLVNGRLSEKTFSRYRKIISVIRPLLSRLELVTTASEEYKQRFVELGVREDKIELIPNCKYDAVITSPISSEEKSFRRAQAFNAPNRTIVLGSLRPGEDELWFPVISNLTSKNADVNIVIAPRHAERFEFFENQLKKFGIVFEKKSSLQNRKCNSKVLLLDTIGDLKSYYEFSDLAFVGGSLIKAGGHNPLEPAAFGAAVLMGPWYENAKEVIEGLVEARGAAIVRSKSDNEAQIERFLSNPSEFAEQGLRARNFSEKFGGIAKTVAQKIYELISLSKEKGLA